MDTPRNLQAGAFAGTAEAYFRYRPPYPKALLASLVTQAHLPGSAVPLDLACGPGRVTLDLAASFEHVHAIDLEAEMIEVDRREATRRGVRNVEWRVGRAEEASVAAESVDLITIGEAFHRLGQVAIIENALDWLKPGGCIAILGTYSILAGGEAWRGGQTGCIQTPSARRRLHRRGDQVLRGATRLDVRRDRWLSAIDLCLLRGGARRSVSDLRSRLEGGAQTRRRTLVP